MNVQFTNTFLKEVKKLRDKKLKQDIIQIIQEAEKAESVSVLRNIKKLKGYNVYYRIRLGDYGIGLKWETKHSSLPQ